MVAAKRRLSLNSPDLTVAARQNLNETTLRSRCKNTFAIQPYRVAAEKKAFTKRVETTLRSRCEKP
eukprot:297976-Amphidinium_carterae.1